MASDFKIGGSTVNSRDDWQHVPAQAGPSSRRLESFPGYGGAFDVVGPRGVRRFAVVGWLVSATLAGLMSEVDDWDEMRSSPGTVTVQIHGQSYTRCRLDNLAPVSDNVAFLDSNGAVFQRRRYRFDFIQLEGA